MTLEEGFATYLLAQSAITDLVGTRIHANQVPQQSSYPAIRFQRIAGQRWRNLSGHSNRDRARIQVDVYGTTYSSVNAAAKVVKDTVDSYTGLMGTVVVDGVVLESDEDLYEDEVDLHRAILDFMISYVEQ